MRPILRYLLATPAVVLAAACGDADDSRSALSAELERDLELAKATSVELASASRAPAATSGLELAPPGASAPSERAAVPTPQRRQSPQLVTVARRSPRAAPAPAPADEAVDDATLGAEPAAEPAPAEGERAEAPAEAPESVGGPELGTEGIGAGRPRDPGGFGGVGDAGVGDGGGSGGGAVIRGGPVGEDDCRLPGHGGIRIGGRGYPAGPIFIPGGRPVYRPGTISGGSSDGRQRAGATVRGRGGSSGGAVMGGSGRTSGGSTAVGGGSRRRGG